MHILYMHQYFITRGGYSGTRSYEFAKYLVGQGHRVTMICSGIDNEEQLTTPPGKQYFEVDVEGIHCVPIAAGFASGHKGTGMSGYRRMANFLQFSRLAKQVGKQLARPDIVFATHTPLPIGLAGMAVSRHFGTPFVFEVRDLWPTAMINIGALTNPLAIWYLRRMEKKIYRAADHIVALSPGMKAGVCSTGIADERVSVITNASDIDLFRPDVDPAPGRERLGLGERFAAIYFGAMGLANGLEYPIEAARILQQRGNDQIVIVLHGAGGKRAELEQLVAHYDLKNVIFSDPVPDKATVASLVAGCNVCLTIYKATTEHTWTPNKMFDALAAGRPVLINVPGWLRETIENNDCGRGLDPQRPQELADTLEEFAADPQLCEQMGHNARRLAETEFAREKLAARLEAIFERVLAQRRM
ncbi:MAG: glycosyltransferase family 4 protein [Planctomycetes bacterium]|nr:glycosyltransferase family 4 protein [Planctomycetota bacterium]